MYLRLIGYHLHVRKKDNWLKPIILTNNIFMPLSKKRCKVSLKNVRRYCYELMQVDCQIDEIEINKIVAVGRYIRGEQDEKS